MVSEVTLATGVLTELSRWDSATVGASYANFEVPDLKYKYVSGRKTLMDLKDWEAAETEERYSLDTV